MGFVKHTRAEKVDVVAPSENARINVKTASGKSADLDDVSTCKCETPCEDCKRA